MLSVGNLAVPEFKRSLAVIIGINQYDANNGIPELKTAVHDAEELAFILAEKYQYQVLPLLDTDATQSRLDSLLTALTQKMLPLADGSKVQIEPDDRVLFYFAGHGIALDGLDNAEGPAGYLVPQDARLDDSSSLLPMQRLHDALVQLSCRHLLIILDCCFAGTFRWAGLHRDAVRSPKMYRERYERFTSGCAHQVITSAAYDEKALDSLYRFGQRGRLEGHSPFADLLLKALNGAADLTKDGVLTATELYVYLHSELGKLTAKQTPGFCQLKGHDKGEYIFVSPDFVEEKLQKAPALDEQSNPYRGLESFDEAHKELFFGRQRVINELYAHLSKREKPPLTIVLGASGTGKSSLVKAGLLPRLREKQWQIIEPLRPGKSPFTALAKEVLHATDASARDDLNCINGLSENLQQAPQTFTKMVSLGNNCEQKLILVIDQFEELVTMCQPEEQQQFLGWLKAVLVSNLERLHVVITLRSDFEPQFSSVLLERSQWMAARFVIPPMTQDELREVIEKPAAETVMYFEPPKLVDRLINDVVEMPGALPLLSFTLRELYLKYLQRRGNNRAMTQEDYEDLGGVMGSLTKRATEEYKKLVKLDPANEQTVRRVMLRMVSVEGGESARRRVPETELVYRDAEENERVKQVIQAFSEARLIVEGTNSQDEPCVEPAHDALVRGWDKLQQWKQQQQESLPLQRLLTPAATEWDRNKQAKFLWNANPRLDLLKQGLDAQDNWFNKVEAEFVERSIGRKRRNIALRWIAIGGLLAATTAAAFYFNHLRQVADRRELTARENLYASNLNLASQEWGKAHITQMMKLLNNFYPQGNQSDLRGFEWYYFWKLAHSDRLTLSHDQAVTSVAISPDGQTLATVNSDMRTMSSQNSVKLWDMATGKELATLPGHKDGTVSVAFSPNGKILATGGLNDASVKLWDIQTGKEIKSYRAGSGNESGIRSTYATVHSVQFSPDGQTVALFIEPLNAPTGAEFSTLMYFGRIVKLLDVTTGKEKGNFNFGDVRNMAFSPDGKTFATSYNNETVKLWDLTSGKELGTLQLETGWAGSLAFSPDGKKLAMGGEEVRIWDVVNKGTPQRVGQHQGNIVSVTFSLDGKTLATASRDRTVKLWDTATYREVATLKGHTESISYIAFSPDSKTLVTGSADKTAKLWNIEQFIKQADSVGDSFAFSSDGKTLVTWDAGASFGRVVVGSEEEAKLLDAATLQEFAALNPASIESALFSLNSQFLVTWDTGEVKLWDVNTGQELTNRLQWSWEDDFNQIHSVAIAPDGKILAVGGYQAVKLWHTDKWGSLPTLKSDEGYIQSMRFSPDSKLLVTGNVEGIIEVWNTTTWQKQTSFKSHKDSVERLEFSPDGKTLITASNDGTIKLWNTAIWQEQATLKSTEYSPVWAFSLDSKSLALATKDNSVQLWDLAKFQRISTFEGHTDSVLALAFSPDSQRLVTGSADETVKLWNVVRGIELLTLGANLGEVRAVGFALDGRTLIVSHWQDDKRQVKFWQAATDEEIWVHSLRTANPILFEEGRNLANKGNLEEAVAQFQKILRSNSKLDVDPEVVARYLAVQELVKEARTLAKEWKFEGAVAKFQKALALNHKLNINPQVDAKRSIILAHRTLVVEGEKHISNGFEYRQQSDHKNALAEFTKGINLVVPLIKKGYPPPAALLEAYLERGVMYYVQGDYKNAVADWQAAIQVKPNDSRAYSNLGFAYYELEQLDEAIVQWKTAVELEPKFDESWAGLGIALYNKGQREAAIAAYKKALEIEPSFASTAWLRNERSWSEKSLSTTTQLLEIIPKSSKP